MLGFRLRNKPIKNGYFSEELKHSNDIRLKAEKLLETADSKSYEELFSLCKDLVKESKSKHFTVEKVVKVLAEKRSKVKLRELFHEEIMAYTNVDTVEGEWLAVIC